MNLFFNRYLKHFIQLKWNYLQIAEIINKLKSFSSLLIYLFIAYYIYYYLLCMYKELKVINKSNYGPKFLRTESVSYRKLV